MGRQNDRYWTWCHNGKHTLLFRLEHETRYFCKWEDNEWKSAFNLYSRVAWDCDFDEINETLADRILDGLKEGKAIDCECCELS